MFDDQQNQNQPAGIPGNLPTAEPDDMFGGVDPAPPAAAPAAPAPATAPDPGMESPPPVGEATAAPEVAAMPPQTALGAGALRPKTEASHAPQMSPPIGQTAPPSTMQPGMPPAQSMPPGAGTGIDYDVKSPSAAKGVVTIVIAAVVILILGGGGWWIYSNFIRVPDVGEGPATVSDNTFEEPLEIPEETSNEIPLVTTDDTGTGTEDMVINEPKLDETVVDDQVLFGEPIDRDADGIDDATEERLGTDPNNWDTDGDELSDGDEVNVWKTSPLNPDSDGDTYEDGSEVKNGYNPAGPGKLFEIPTTTPAETATATGAGV